MERVPRVTRGRDGWARWGRGGLGTPPTEASESGSAGRTRTAARAEGEHPALDLDLEAALLHRRDKSASTRLGRGAPGAAGAACEGICDDGGCGGIRLDTGLLTGAGPG